MQLYKFKALDDVKHVLDIILNERLFCAEWKNLNDPTEGMFSYYDKDSYDKSIRTKVKAVVEAKGMKKICALSKTFDSHLLWAHYADGFRGIAIEVNIPDEIAKKVEYENNYTMIDGESPVDSQTLAEQVLCKKFRDWDYEREYRIIQGDEYYKKNDLINRLIFGHRIDESLHKMLQLICKQKNIPMAKTSIGLNGQISAIPYPIRNGPAYFEALRKTQDADRLSE